ncbi:hypothetical protein SAMN05444149_101877 [Pseudosulfitobacter pseudonitzschiae]|uniref:hypothetical protein n=1 Tax=Pseudosulfitobacter pseudonitzschiae TaxID=1402135 RepID=UPI0009102FB5|nr:hypothetical protein [Pseudosulfitobacter pseudonitzschiae]QKS08735.1 hypothetical protein HT745_09715 [Pseudosulfitobacter pseudonitzschiae]SHE70606.1 hypothetical protein SAMN05444149_101877 [Pseudosulfitobacter pseudonitzschiae]
MTEANRTKMLERALIKYIEMYGFIDEARVYFELTAEPEQRTMKQAMFDLFRRRNAT